MLSEDFDKKVKEAADHHHPAYDEKAWNGMKKLLDKHLPEEREKRRRIIFFLLFPLLLAGGGWFLISQFSGNNNEPAVAKNGNTINTDAGTAPVNRENTEKGNAINADLVKQSDNSTNDDPATAMPADNTAGENALPENQDLQAPAGILGDKQQSGKNIAITAPGTSKKKVAPGQRKGINRQEAALVSADNSTDNKKEYPEAPASPSPVSDNASVPGKTPLTVTDSKDKTNETAAPVGDSKQAQSKPDETAKSEQEKKNEKEVVKAAKSSRRKSSFSFSISGGPDVSYTGNGRPGRMKFLGGAGIGYTYREKFTLRTGFYSARKIYTASPEEYHGPDWFSLYYPNMQKIDADCKVYEIPLSLSYNFGANKKQSWFTSAGVSTLLMKRETYNYFYKYYPAGPVVNKEFTIQNENKHFFSLLTLSAGYQRNISDKISVTAEPYFKFPLKGVGAGKVKLNSGGVLFTLSYKPFRQQK